MAKTERHQCAKCKYTYDRISMRQCPYSKKGAWICVYCCKKCRYVFMIGTGFGCELIQKKEQNGEEKKA